ncbi:hypothetical protein OPV22_014314 [Ensete ventricosum]|uniref:Uncharacterized protein n=1 Tax=Ensete ventricosum TaxID=4639 RepID=A0AAV8PK15_ENSVE|nr:hypothetical protein OPV22_014314 [Ensete ventricosum]
MTAIDFSFGLEEEHDRRFDQEPWIALQSDAEIVLLFRSDWLDSCPPFQSFSYTRDCASSNPVLATVAIFSSSSLIPTTRHGDGKGLFSNDSTAINSTLARLCGYDATLSLCLLTKRLVVFSSSVSPLQCHCIWCRRRR